jgi:hypothetical protein
MTVWRSEAEAEEEREWAVVDRAMGLAEDVVAELNDAWRVRELDPSVTVELRTGSDGGPILAFTIWIGLEDDFDPKDYPAALIGDLKATLRGTLASRIDGLPWYTIVNSREPAAA